ncbi:hypothetical protein [Halogeometricum sp. CBA1124]|uniref:hypothetical protein n=1 Tax=Halogeometricum sp. CBA1124 TaxID=2668071 RepID=UPI001429C2A2|nr:hypothetical protein [Halogeometricum sp. CBA1124]MUV58150.1 hypothetical protein [Halogeometricum sp. CBA1124]
MNQTSDVIGAASAANPFPDVATFAFHDHNRTSLVHSPDPQVKPRWKRFGYGHGDVGSGPAPPSDLTYDRDAPESDELVLDLNLPETVFPGELVIVDVTVENPTDEPRDVTSALNITEDYLSLHVRSPDGTRTTPRNVVRFCTDRQTTRLNPGERLTGRVQLLYTNQGFTFDRPGPYTLWAELDLGDRTLRSPSTDVLTHSPLSEDSLDLSTLGLNEASAEASRSEISEWTPARRTGSGRSPRTSLPPTSARRRPWSSRTPTRGTFETSDEGGSSETRTETLRATSSNSPCRIAPLSRRCASQPP